jgi:L-ascorbate metabolism protein UlaG (beta-lactamase superfamily)
MRLRLIRNATLLVKAGGKCLLIDPMLDPAGARPPRDPLVELPEPAEVVIIGLDAALVTQLHPDHFDAEAVRLLPKDLPLFCRAEDADGLRGHGFADVRPVKEELEWDDLRIARAGTGFVLAADDEPVLYVAGDTVWSDELDRHRPQVIVINAGAAPTADDVVAVARRAPDARVVAVHLEAIDHCPLTRADLHQRLHDEGLTERVTVPEDGAEVPLV